MEKRISDLEQSIISLAKDVKEIKESLLEGFSKTGNNFVKITNRFDTIEADLNIINAKVDKLDGNTSNSLKSVDGKLDDLKTEIKKIGNVTGYDHMIANQDLINKKGTEKLN